MLTLSDRKRGRLTPMASPVTKLGDRFSALAVALALAACFGSVAAAQSTTAPMPTPRPRPEPSTSRILPASTETAMAPVAPRPSPGSTSCSVAPVPDCVGGVCGQPGTWYAGTCDPCTPRMTAWSAENPCAGGAWTLEGMVRNAFGWTSPSQLVIDGWLSQGFTANADSPPDRFNLPMGFNDRSNEYQMNQLYLRLGREVNRQPCTWDIGGQVDLLYGTDYVFVESLGLETHSDGSQRWNSEDGPRTDSSGGSAALYGLAMPQLYAEVYAPWMSGVSVKMGHFYTILGYESAPAPENFFYSRSYTYMYAEPITHTGLLVDAALTPCLSVQAGFTRGWDTWEDPNDSLAILGGVKWTAPSDRTSLAFAFHTGNEDPAGSFNRFVYSIVATHEIMPCVRYVLQHDFGYEDNFAFSNGGRSDAQWYTLAQYLYWDIFPTLSAGVRAEWFTDPDHARILQVFGSSGQDYWELTCGLNWRPCPQVRIRPEIRWDWSDVEPPGGGGVYHNRQKTEQLTGGFDILLLY